MIYTILMYMSLALFFLLSLITVYIWRKSIKQGVQRMKHLTLTMDELIEENHQTGNYNRIFKNTLESNQSIDHYILSKEDKTTFLLCHLKTEDQPRGWLKVVCYNAYQKPVGVIWVNMSDYDQGLPPVPLMRSTVFVNLDTMSTQALDVTTPDPIALRTLYRRMSLWISVTLFFLWVPIGYFILKALSEERFTEFLNIRTMLLGLSLMIMMILLHFVLYRAWAKRQHQAEVEA